jgi:K+-transporting ATPase KdpF subunit
MAWLPAGTAEIRQHSYEILISGRKNRMDPLRDSGLIESTLPVRSNKSVTHAGPSLSHRRSRLFRRELAARTRPRPDLTGAAMTMDFISGDLILGGLAALGLLGYLVFALLRPERF